MLSHPYRLLLANLNHSVRVQDLFVQTLAEWKIDVAVVTEPYQMPRRHNWLGDTGGLVAVVREAAANATPLYPVAKRRGYVAAEWGEPW